MKKKSTKYLSIKGINFSFGNSKVLTNLSLDLEKDSIMGLVGESGSGKTTLLKAIAGKYQYQARSFLLDGAEHASGINSLLNKHERVLLVDQHLDLDLFKTVDENLLRFTKGLSNAAKARRLKALKEILSLGRIGTKKVNHLSGGQMQRIAIGSALAANTSLLLLDEPFSHLDFGLRNRLMEWLKEERPFDAMIIVTHDPNDMLSICNSIAVMQKGKLVQKGSPTEIYSRPKSLSVARLFGLINELDHEDSAYFNSSDLVRPSSVLLKKDGLKAQLKNIEFCGTHYILSFKSSISGAIIKCSVDSTHAKRLEVGESYNLWQ